MQQRKLKEVSKIIMGQSPKGSSYNNKKIGLPLLNGAADYKNQFFNPKQFTSQPTRIAKKGDIIFGVRATIGNFAIADGEYCIGRGVSAIRVNEKIISKNYLINILKKRVQLLKDRAAGSTIKGIKKEDLTEMIISLPPLKTQQRIAEILDNATALREKTAQLHKEYDLLAQAIFLEIFGNPVTNPKGWDIINLGDAGELNRGKSKHRPRNAPELLGGKYPLIQTGDVANSNGYITEFKSTYSEFGLAQSRMWPKGTLCITIAANIAKTSILTFDSCFPDSIVGFVPNEKTNNEFVQYWMSFLQKIIEEKAPVSAQKNINLKILRELEFYCPPIKLQNQFAEKITLIEQQKELAKQELKESEDLFNCLLQKAFKGELN
jgi:type I restriction enzyme S subunit